MDSPCHYCDKRPCYEHDTCERYLKYRARIDAMRSGTLRGRLRRGMSKLCGVRNVYTTTARVLIAKYMTIPITTPIIIALTEKGRSRNERRKADH